MHFEFHWLSSFPIFLLDLLHFFFPFSFFLVNDIRTSWSSRSSRSLRDKCKLCRPFYLLNEEIRRADNVFVGIICILISSATCCARGGREAASEGKINYRGVPSWRSRHTLVKPGALSLPGGSFFSLIKHSKINAKVQSESTRRMIQNE